LRSCRWTGCAMSASRSRWCSRPTPFSQGRGQSSLDRGPGTSAGTRCLGAAGQLRRGHPTEALLLRAAYGDVENAPLSSWRMYTFPSTQKLKRYGAERGWIQVNSMGETHDDPNLVLYSNRVGLGTRPRWRRPAAALSPEDQKALRRTAP
jgi:hypothetical protein